MKALWDKRPEESPAAYQAFCVFKDMGESRNVVDAYRKGKGKPLAKQADGNWNKWAHQHEWQLRADAYDREQREKIQRQRDKELADEEREWARRRRVIRDAEWNLAESLRAKAEQMLKVPIITQVQDKVIEKRQHSDGTEYETVINRTIIKAARWEMLDAAKMIQMATEMMRLAAGLPTSHTSTDILNVDVGDGSDSAPANSEEVDNRILELLERARARRDAQLAESAGEGGTEPAADSEGSQTVETESGSSESGLLQQSE